MNNIISYKEIIEEMDRTDTEGKPVRFSIKFVTADRIRKTGGEIITVDKAEKCVGKKAEKVIHATPINTNREPNHKDNQTRNIYIPDSGQVRKVHTRLIIEFNGLKVIP
jgi:hypothetical protein